MKWFANSWLLTALWVLLAALPLAAQQDVPFERSAFPDQRDGLRDARRALQEGDRILATGNEHQLRDAIPFFEAAYDFNPNNSEVNFKLGLCYLHSFTKPRALRYFKKAFELNPNVHDQVHYYLARAYHLNMDWDKAIEHYKLHRNQLVSRGQQEEREKVIRHIEECSNGRELMKNPLRVWIDNMGPNINSEFHDYALVINADETRLMFTSRRPGTTGGKIDPDINDYFEDVYISQFIEGQWTPARNMGDDFNTDTHDASVSMSADGQTIFLFRFNRRTKGDIYVSTLRDDGYWTKPDKLGKPINSDAHESSASLAPDNRTLYFVSDRDGGQGGRDIYVTRWDERRQRWGEAENLGPSINTPYDEEGVFIHPDGRTLYFSSEGHNSMGGMDVMYSTLRDDGTWTVPKNMGFPINTPDHDVFFVPAANSRFAYFTSVREEGFGGRDNYRVTFLGEPKKPVLNAEDNLIASLSKPIAETVVEAAVEIKTNSLAMLRGLVLDDDSGQPLKATIELTDNSTGEVVAAFSSEGPTGKYLVTLPSGVNYGIAMEAEGYLFHSENFNIPADAQFKSYKKDIRLKKIEIGKAVVLRNIFFDTNKFELRPESKSELERLEAILVENPQIRMEISGHTDSDGSAQHNQKLSENRAKAVVDFLISRGVDKSRLVYAGYGQDQPIASNDTAEGKQQNRRTEFKIIE